MADSRFDSVGSDPRFRQLTHKQRKVKIDNRFKSMFEDKKFKLKYTVDKRGRRVDTSTNDHLKKLYALSESESSSSDESDKNDESEDEKKDEEDKAVPDYARGKVDMSGSSSSSEEEEDDAAQVAEPEMLHDWGELDRDASPTEEATRRLAVCNMDWDNIKALDLFLLFDGLDKRTSSGGIVQAVKIYPSDYGVERMEKEQAQGPTELVDKELRKKLNPSKARKAEDEEKVNSELLRKYEMNRLKYYYAVVDCDSAKTAAFFYDQLNGCEYELGGQLLDLRFIPDDMTFDREPRDVATARPDTSNYKVKKHVIPALQNTTVDLSWDVTPNERLAITTRKYTNEELETADLKAYLASASEDDEDCDLEARMKSIAEQEGGSEGSDDETTVTESSIRKYRALIESLNKDTPSKNEDEEMEFTWELGVKDATEKKLKKKAKAEDETPWENYIERMKEKKRLKRSEKRKKKRAATAGDSSDDDDDSDDSLPAGVDLSDPYFAEELQSNDDFPSITSKKKKKHIKDAEAKKEEEAENKRQEDELALLVNGGNSDKKKMKEKKAKNKKRKNKQLEEDIPAKIVDARFEDMYKDPLYSVDPSATEFKKRRKH